MAWRGKAASQPLGGRLDWGHEGEKGPTAGRKEGGQLTTRHVRRHNDGSGGSHRRGGRSDGWVCGGRIKSHWSEKKSQQEETASTAGVQQVVTVEELDTWILGRENPCFWGLWGEERKGRDSVCARLASLAGVHPVPRQPSTETTENAAERVSIAGVRPREDFQLRSSRWT